MPLYEYECDACGHRFEVIQKFSDRPADACAKCGKGPVNRLLSSPAIQFKGTGWYITDYAQKGKTDKAKSEGGKSEGGKSEGGKSEGGKSEGGSGTAGASDSKTETKTEAKTDTKTKTETKSS